MNDKLPKFNPDHVIAVVFIATLIFAIVVLPLLAMHRNAERAALCPAGTVYVASADACLPGARPWEGDR